MPISINPDNIHKFKRIRLLEPWITDDEDSDYYGITGDVFEVLDTSKDGVLAKLLNPNNGAIAWWSLDMEPAWESVDVEPFTDKEYEEFFV